VLLESSREPLCTIPDQVIRSSSRRS